jgi:class 3 adenylate cyclase/tetratricopeptide (TPR) repeat protein
MRCPRCQHENRPPARFCEECATPLARTCPNCGLPASPTAKFCSKCAQPLAGPPGAQPPFASPEAYTPKQLAERIPTSEAAPEGERKQVTVLFADVKDSMELLADRDPEEARKILDPVLERMMEAVHRYEGTVNQVMGDGIMALFGAPLAHEDHAVRACYAALRMQQSVKKYAEEVRRSHAAMVKIRVGLNSGEVVVRTSSSDLHKHYSAVGQTTHLAAWMEQLARPGTVRLTEHTCRLVEGLVQVTSLGTMPVKGVAAPINIFELTGPGAGRTRLKAAATRGLTRFVGRNAEIAALQHALDRAGGGYGQMVAVIAEPGVGKSRLVWELTHSERVQQWRVLEGDAASHEKATPYLPVIELFQAYFQIEDQDEAASIREKVTSKLMALDEALMPDVVVFLGLLDVPVDDPQWQALDPAQRRRRTLDACRRLLLRESRVRPLLIVFENLHWIDSETQAMLDTLVESLPAESLLLVVTYRPEYQHGWGGKTYYTDLRLDPLPPKSADELLTALLGSDPQLESLKRVLIERTEGNPFFLEESARTLVETGALAGDRGAYCLTTSTDTLTMPATIHSVLAARIDRLPAEDKRLLQAAAVIGKDVPIRLLEAVAEVSDETLGRLLSNLRAAEFLYETRLFPEVEYTFKHALTHDVAYGGILQSRRRALHGRIVETIETLYSERLAEQVDRLAHHAVRGEAWDKAVLYLRQAADKAAGRSAHRAAVRYVEEALVALTRVSPTPETTAQAIDLRFAIRNWLFALGEHAQIRAHLEEAQGLAQASEDVGRLAWTSVYMSNYFWREGDPEEAIALARRALAIADERHDAPLRVTANLRLGQAYHGRGDYRRATGYVRENVVALEGDFNLALFGLAGLPSVFSRGFLVWSLAELGEFREGLALGEEAIRIADASQQMYSRAMAHFVLGFLHLQQGEPKRAASTLERGLAIQQSGEILALRAMLLAGLGHTCTLSGRSGEAVSLLEQSVEPSVFVRSPQHPFPFMFLGKAYLEAGRIEQSLAAASRCLELCRTRRDRGGQAWSLSLLAEIGLRLEPLDAERVLERWREAMALATELGMRPLISHCHLGLTTLYRRTGKTEQAHEHLTTATTMYREMDMRFWVEKAEAEMRSFG